MLKPLYKILTHFLQKNSLYLIKGLVFLGRKTSIPLNKLDYVRVASLELIANEILLNNIPGHVAELGVYKGGFAKYINQLFHNRKLFLFDTFAGFTEQDITKERSAGLDTGDQDFSNTNTGKVLSQMPFPDKCVIKKGYFPDTFTGMEEERFCFVSIDADLYEPVSKGLSLFYSSLLPGGYLMVHDFNNTHYKGCRKAVLEFCKAHSVSYVPIPDIGGSVIIQKP